MTAEPIPVPTTEDQRAALLARRRAVEAKLGNARTVGDVWAINAELTRIDKALGLPASGGES